MRYLGFDSSLGSTLTFSFGFISDEIDQGSAAPILALAMTKPITLINAGSADLNLALPAMNHSYSDLG